MPYYQIAPPASLKDYVQYFWVLEEDPGETLPRNFGPLADGSPGILFQSSHKGTFFCNKGIAIPEFSLHGQTVELTSLRLEGNFSAAGLSFLPNTLRCFFDIDAHTLVDTCVNLSDLPETANMLTPDMLRMRSREDRLQLLIDFLLQTLSAKQQAADPVTAHAISMIINAGFEINCQRIHQKLQRSARNIERRFQRQVGVSPHQFMRIYRFRAAFQQLQEGRYGKLSDIAYENGYADQAHFIREFKQYTGSSPLQFSRQPVLSPVFIPQPYIVA